MGSKPWPAVVLGSVCIACFTILAVLHVDTSAFMSAIGVVIVPVLGALVYGEVRQISNQTNGNVGELLRLVRRLSEQLAASTPPTAAQETAGGEQA